ncbi:MAG: IS1380 family transposase [Proteobacteria bacterium]|nr:IS1380 family transposase [Pseudomonadota bacterium]
MVKMQNRDITNSLASKGLEQRESRARKINSSTAFETCTEQISPFGGLLGLIKFLDLIKFEKVFNHLYIAPRRKVRLGNDRMVIGILMLLFIGFNRLWHFTYIRLDAIMCGFFQLTRLPVASTFWRYVDSLGINQAHSFLKIMSVLRERVWQLCGLTYETIHLSTDTTVETLYGHQQGGRKGHNTKNRGKKGYRPVLCFIDETREYLLGNLRKGETISGEEVAKFIKKIKTQFPGCVKKVLFRGDGEFFGWKSVSACIQEGFAFIIANKGAHPPFDPKKWYRPKKRKPFEYNSCVYQPAGWEFPCRFVAMRIPKELKSPAGKPLQCELFEDDRYTYRIFCTSLSGKPHKAIAQYDKRADVENLVGESKREGLEAVPSSKFKNNYAYFQIVMLAYNLWRYFKMTAELSNQNGASGTPDSGHDSLKGLSNNLIRIARLKLLLIGAKVVYHSTDKVKYSMMDTRTPGLMHFLNYLDRARARVRPWVEGKLWPCRFSLNTV